MGRQGTYVFYFPRRPILPFQMHHTVRLLGQNQETSALIGSHFKLGAALHTSGKHFPGFELEKWLSSGRGLGKK